MLNDRDKVNRIGSQHGFIHFIVSPLAIASARIFQSLSVLSEQMVENLEGWRTMWIKDAIPSQEDIDKRTTEVHQIVALIEPLVGMGGNFSKRASIVTLARAAVQVSRGASAPPTA